MTEEDMLDEDGYPTEAALEKIRNWPYLDGLEALRFIKSLWHYPNYAKESVDRNGEKRTHFEFVTGGWSGNEDLLAALGGNRMIKMLSWRGSLAGGWHHYAFPQIDSQPTRKARTP